MFSRRKSINALKSRRYNKTKTNQRFYTLFIKLLYVVFVLILCLWTLSFSVFPAESPIGNISSEETISKPREFTTRSRESTKIIKTEKEDSSSSFYKTTWPPLQQALCGNGAPNPSLYSILFELACSEAFHPNDPRLATIPNATTSTTKERFFTGDYDTRQLKGTNQNGEPFHTVYLTIYKCANNQIYEILQDISKHFNETSTFVRKRSLEGVLKHLARNKKKPCLFTAIRDPVSHFLSGYNEIETRLLGTCKPDECPWRGPYHFKVPYDKKKKGTPEHVRQKRFRTFVEDFLLEDEIYGHELMYEHIFTMSRVLGTVKKHNFELAGYIPQLHNITSTLPSFLSSTCPNFYPEETIPAMSIKGQHSSSSDHFGLYAAAKAVWKEAGPIARALCVLHSVDYACFQDLPEGIPELCRSVYQKYAGKIVDHAEKIKSTTY